LTRSPHHPHERVDVAARCWKGDSSHHRVGYGVPPSSHPHHRRPPWVLRPRSPMTTRSPATVIVVPSVCRVRRAATRLSLPSDPSRAFMRNAPLARGSERLVSTGGTWISARCAAPLCVRSAGPSGRRRRRTLSGRQGSAGADSGSATVKVVAGGAYEVQQRIVLILHLVRPAVRLVAVLFLVWGASDGAHGGMA
jgi:hypothetical protein